MTSNVRTPINSVTQTPIAAHNVPDEYHCSALITMAGIQADTGKATRGEGRRGRHGAQRPDLVELLREHQAEQERERKAARQLRQDGGWLFTDSTGGILNPRTDTKHWKELHMPGSDVAEELSVHRDVFDLADCGLDAEVCCRLSERLGRP